MKLEAEFVYSGKRLYFSYSFNWFISP